MLLTQGQFTINQNSNILNGQDVLTLAAVTQRPTKAAMVFMLAGCSDYSVNVFADC